MADMSRLQSGRNRKAIEDILAELIAGTASETKTRVFLQSLGLTEATANALILDASDGTVDTDLSGEDKSEPVARGIEKKKITRHNRPGDHPGGGASPARVGQQVTHDGGKYTAEPVDGDDSFPPAVASYSAGDGYIFYKGRNGSEGVVAGSPEELSKWMTDVSAEVSSRAVAEYERWTESKGGSEYIARASDAAGKAASMFGVQRPEVTFGVLGESSAGGDHGDKITIYNAHRNDPSEFAFKTSVTKGEQIAAHEVMHAVFSGNSERGSRMMKRLSNAKKKISPYQTIGSDFEGLMDLGAAYVTAPNELRQYSPELFQIAEDWKNETNGS